MNGISTLPAVSSDLVDNCPNMLDISIVTAISKPHFRTAGLNFDIAFPLTTPLLRVAWRVFDYSILVRIERYNAQKETDEQLTRIYQDVLNAYMLFVYLIAKVHEFKWAVRYYYAERKMLLIRNPSEAEILEFPERPNFLSTRHTIHLTPLEEAPSIKFCEKHSCDWTLTTRCRDCVTQAEYQRHTVSTLSEANCEETEREFVDT